MAGRWWCDACGRQKKKLREGFLGWGEPTQKFWEGKTQTNL